MCACAGAVAAFEQVSNVARLLDLAVGTLCIEVDRVLALHAKYRDKGVALVAISVSQLETDGLSEMKKRATAKKYGFSYLHDATQKIGHAYGATSTPQVFLLDGARKVAYMGKIDDCLHADKVTEPFLADAIDAVLIGKQPEVTDTKPTGCPIEYERP